MKIEFTQPKCTQHIGWRGEAGSTSSHFALLVEAPALPDGPREPRRSHGERSADAADAPVTVDSRDEGGGGADGVADPPKGDERGEGEQADGSTERALWHTPHEADFTLKEVCVSQGRTLSSARPLDGPGYAQLAALQLIDRVERLGRGDRVALRLFVRRGVLAGHSIEVSSECGRVRAEVSGGERSHEWTARLSQLLLRMRDGAASEALGLHQRRDD